jgi:hypothetical protein
VPDGFWQWPVFISGSEAAPAGGLFHGTKYRRRDWIVSTEVHDMRRTKPLATRNKINVADAGQIRILKKRLGISSDDLQRVVAKVGNSIAAVTKEIESQKPLPLTAAAPVQNNSALPSATGVTASV